MQSDALSDAALAAFLTTTDFNAELKKEFPSIRSATSEAYRLLNQKPAEDLSRLRFECNADDFQSADLVKGFQGFMKTFSSKKHQRIAKWKEFELPPASVINSLKGAIKKGLPLTTLKLWLSNVTVADLDLLKDLLLTLGKQKGKKVTLPTLSLLFFDLKEANKTGEVAIDLIGSVMKSSWPIFTISPKGELAASTEAWNSLLTGIGELTQPIILNLDDRREKENDIPYAPLLESAHMVHNFRLWSNHTWTRADLDSLDKALSSEKINVALKMTGEAFDRFSSLPLKGLGPCSIFHRHTDKTHPFVFEGFNRERKKVMVLNLTGDPGIKSLMNFAKRIGFYEIASQIDKYLFALLDSNKVGVRILTTGVQLNYKLFCTLKKIRSLGFDGELTDLGRAIGEGKLPQLREVSFRSRVKKPKGQQEFAKSISNKHRLIKLEIDGLEASEEGKDVLKQVHHNRVHVALECDSLIEYRRCKFMFIGNMRAGKSSTMRSLLGLEFKEDLPSTLVAEADTEVSLAVQDISGNKWRSKKLAGKHHFLTGEFTMAVDRFEKSPAAYSRINLDQTDALRNFKLENISSQLMMEEKLTKRSQEKEEEKQKLKSTQGEPQAVTDTSFQNPFQFVEDEHNVNISLWDFGGQSVFHNAHRLYLTDKGVYVLIFNMEKMKDELSGKANGTETEGVFPEMVALKDWLDSLSSYASGASVFLVGTRAKSVSPQETVKLNKEISAIFRNYPEINLVKHTKKKLMFFPVENSMGNDNEEYLAPIRDKFKRLITSDDSTEVGKLVKQEIKLSWVYFMNYVLTKEQNRIRTQEVLTLGKQFGIEEQEVRDIIRFYNEAGTIIAFDDGEPALRDIIVLQPEWLLDALAGFLYDVDVHESKRYEFEDDAELEQAIVTYEESGVLTDKVLEALWENEDYDDDERKFVTSVCMKTLIFSKYDFEATEKDDDDDEPNRSYLVPGMIKKVLSQDEIESMLPPLKDRLTSYFHFKTIPKGLFTRTVCVFLAKSNAVEGSREPLITSNHANFQFAGVVISLTQMPDSPSIRIVVQDIYRMQMYAVLDLCEEILEQLQSAVSAKNMQPKLLVQSRSTNKPVRCEYRALLNAANGEKDSVDVIEGMMTVSLTEFNGFLAGRTASADENADNPVSEQEFDCFLAHEWGTSASGFETHNRVKAVGEQLKAKGYRVWLDENSIHARIDNDIMKGLKNSRCVVVFLTKRYLERLDDGNTNAAKEFTSAIKKGVDKFIIVLLDARIANPNTWFGVFDYHLGNLLYTGFSSQEDEEKNFPELCSRLDRVLAGTKKEE